MTPLASARRARRRWPLAVGAMLLGLLVTSPAVAQNTPSPAASKKAAVAHAEQGWQLFSNGRYKEALAAFEVAESTLHGPPFLLMIARCHEKLGRLLDARAVYRRIVDEKLPPAAPRGFVKAQADAASELVALEPRIPTVEIVLTGSARGAVELSLDGAQVSPSTAVPCDPGEHAVRAVIPGRPPVALTLHLTEGTKERVAIESSPLPEALRPSAIPPQPAPDPDASRRRTVLLAGGAAVGVGVVLGATFGILAISARNEAQNEESSLRLEGGERACAGGQRAGSCDHMQGRYEDAALFTNVAAWSVVGAVVAGAGTGAYWFLSPRAETTGRVRINVAQVARGAGIQVSGGW